MPNLPAHLSLAMDAASRIQDSRIDRHLGCFLLGSTAPDIRAMTKWNREVTHFVPLAVRRVGDGAQGMFREYPALADSSVLDGETAAFLSGYITHLVSDETWILDVYQPYFDGNGDPEKQVRANIWDRALQLDLDRAAWETLQVMDRLETLLGSSESGVGIEFISPETLREWRGRVTEFAFREFSWERLRFATNRMYRDDSDAMKIAEEFLQCVPASLQNVYDKIPTGTITTYRENAIGASVKLIKEYLGVP